jgi:hypothetical protein
VRFTPEKTEKREERNKSENGQVEYPEEAQVKTTARVCLVFLLVAVIIFAGCTQRPAPLESVPQPSFTTTIPETGISPVISPRVSPTTPEITPYPTTLPTKTPAPADPTDISQITFLPYSDDDFSMDYPSTWTVATSLYTPYQVGPFYLYDDPRLNKPYRVVTFTSPDNTKKVVALTQDFTYAGVFLLNPTVDWARGMFQRDYPDLTPVNYLGNYKYFSTGNTMASSYEVKLPRTSPYYPSAYSVKTMVTTRNVYNFGFFTDTTTFDTYRNLEERIISSIKTKNPV